MAFFLSYLYFFNLLLITIFLLRQLDRDCEFLEAERIMDYSLLIGLHFRDDYSSDDSKMSPNVKHIGKLFCSQGP